MARIIDLQFNENKTYALEFDRRSVYRLMEAKSEEKSAVEELVDIIHFGLLKHHENDMPTKEDIYSFLMCVDDLQGFTNELAKCVQDTIVSIKEDKERGNVKWGVRK